MEALAGLAEYSPTDLFPRGQLNFQYKTIQVAVYRFPESTATFREMVAAVRGLGEYMSISQTFGRRLSRVLVNGAVAGILALEDAQTHDIDRKTSFVKGKGLAESA